MNIRKWEQFNESNNIDTKFVEREIWGLLEDLGFDFRR